MRYKYLILFFILYIFFPIGSVYSQTLPMDSYTIHIFHPWADNPDMNQLGLNLMGKDNYYPGASMTRGGDLWFTYVYEANQAHHVGEAFRIACFLDQNEHEIYDPSPRLSIESLFAGNPDAREVWIIPQGLDEFPQVLYEPPPIKVINFLNPWNTFIPRVLNIDHTDSKRMTVNMDRCGWYSGWYFTDDLDQFLFKFVNSTGEAEFGQEGDGSSEFIDLAGVLATSDTVWINENRDGSVNISSEFPRVLGECPFRILTALVRDQAADGVSFEPDADVFNPNWTGLVTQAVADTLADDGKIIGLGWDGDERFENIEDWFDDDLSPYSTCIDIILTRNELGWWEYDSDWDGGFFPIDDFDNPNNEPGFRDGSGIERNFHFTMELWMYFEYKQGTNQTFIFRGDDDVWVYTNRVLTFDIGGIHGPIADTVNLDEVQDELRLVDGEIYPMSIFFCERMTSGSNFLVKTNIDFRSSRQLFHNTSLLDNGVIEYHVYELSSSDESLDCGQNSFSGAQTPVRAEYILRGPQHREGTHLTSGVNFGGITISDDYTSFIVDTTAISGLNPGFYEVIFRDPDDISRTGSIIFLVSSLRTAPPIPNPNAGTYEEPIQVSFTSATENARIFYTTDSQELFPFNLLPHIDNTDETVIPGSSWRLYTDSIDVSDYLFIRTIAIASQMQPSNVVTYEFFIELPPQIPVLTFIDRIMLLDGSQMDGPVTLADTIYSFGVEDTHSFYIGLPMNVRLAGIDDDSLEIYDIYGRWYIDNDDMQRGYRDSVPPSIIGINDFEFLKIANLKALYTTDENLWDSIYINLKDPVDLITVSSELFVEQYSSLTLNKNSYRLDTIVVSLTDFNSSSFESFWFFESDTFSIETNWEIINIDSQDTSNVKGVNRVSTPRFESGTYRVEVSRPFANDSLIFTFYVRVIDMITFGVIPNPLLHSYATNEGMLYFSNRNMGDIRKFEAIIYDAFGNIVYNFKPWVRDEALEDDQSFILTKGDFRVSYNNENNKLEVRSIERAWNGRNNLKNKVNSGTYVVFCRIERKSEKSSHSAYFYYISNK